MPNSFFHALFSFSIMPNSMLYRAGFKNRVSFIFSSFRDAQQLKGSEMKQKWKAISAVNCFHLDTGAFG